MVENQFSVQTKIVSLSEAEKMLPFVQRTLRELQELHQAIQLVDDIEVELDEESDIELQSVSGMKREYHKLHYLFYSKLELMESKGCIVKDLEHGLIDFRSEFEGKNIFLCWQQGEKSVQHWHSAESGFIGRKKIVDLTK
ncbi:TPA: DUF2203 domain-containing protein [Candidatus Woesearchaeota archaeon]|nr:DUF2203 domain-containing protein [Candidatus Woesearchaeota archaeon]